jgi:hypothetical protein
MLAECFSMLKLVNGMLAIAISTTVLAIVSPASAEEPYPWCAYYSGNEGDNGTNCGFDSRAQCMATISGVGGYCGENPMYPGPHETVTKVRKHHHKKS